MTATSGTVGTLFLGAGELEIIWWFLTPPALSNGTDRYYLYFGVNESATAGTLSNGCGFFYRDNINSGKPIVITHVGGVQQTSATGTTTIAAATAYRVRLVFDAARTKCDMYLKVGTGAENLEATYTGSLPAATTALGVIGEIVKSAGTTAEVVTVDGWQCSYRLTTQR